MSTYNLSDTIVNRTRYLQAFTAVPQRTAAPHAASHVTKYNPYKGEHYASLTGRRQQKSDATSQCALNVTALPVMRRCLCAALAERCLNARKVYLEREKGGHWVKRETKCKN